MSHPSPPRMPPVAEQMALLRRGAVDLVEEGELAARLGRARETGRPLTVKAGFDPTSPDLHLGHTVLLRKMAHFQQCGHRVVFLIGDFTGMIGDPTGKKATRPQLTREQVEENAQTYKRQVFRLLDRERTVIEYNSTWLQALGSEGMIRLAASYTLARMLEREDFKTRLQAHQPISIHELLYPLAQGYDSVALQADVELGGHDQIFNLLVGRELMRGYGLEPQIVLTVPLLVGIDGKDKMSKSLGNAIAVEDPPREMFGKTMSIPDALLWDWTLLLTDLPEAELARRRREVEEGGNPRDAKVELAREIVRHYHGEAAAAAAQVEFEAIFSRGEIPEDIPLVRCASCPLIDQLLVSAQLAPSRNEARRLLEQGAVSIDGERVSDPRRALAARAAPYLIKVGKRRFAKVAVG